MLAIGSPKGLPWARSCYERTTGEDIQAGNQVIERVYPLAYCLGDVHLNLEYPPDLSKYDPGQWLRSNRAPGVACTFLGWGLVVTFARG